jgi:hypothetical protein
MSAYKYYDRIDEMKEQETMASSSAAALPSLKTALKSFDAYGAVPKIEYKYNEGKLLEEITAYINATYGEHYSQNQYQATEFIIDGGHGVGFTVGNILKYAQRYGHKGTPDDWRKDLMKVIHYAIIALHVHDLDHKD